MPISPTTASPPTTAGWPPSNAFSFTGPPARRGPCRDQYCAWPFHRRAIRPT
jgi:hypothetical protein